jgi:hypothetical protein
MPPEGAAIEKARTKRAERTELTADWVVDESGNMRKHEIPAAIEKARTKRAERTELTADWVVDDRCGDLRFSSRIDHVGIMLGDAFGRWRLRQARMSQELGRGTERRGRDRQSSPNSANRLGDAVDHMQTRLRTVSYSGCIAGWYGARRNGLSSTAGPRVRDARSACAQ